MKVNAILALLVGSVLGFVIGRGTAVSDAPTAAALAAAAKQGAAPNTPPARRTRPPEDTTTVHKVVLGDAPILGPASAPITLVEFSDYQCPFCGRGNVTIEQLRKEYGPKIRIVMKQFPLSFHPNARPAALAALAAGEQGKYWEMHAKLFEKQQLQPSDIEGYAKDIGLNVAKWKAAQSKPELAKRIEADQAQGASLGVTGTPAFFVNGRFLSGAKPIESFKAIIDDELAKTSKLVASGVKPDAVYAKIMETASTAPPAAAAAQARPTVTQKVTVPPDSPFVGPRNAKVTIVEWSDFQCPFCSRALNTVKELEQKYPNDVKIVFRNLPLPMHNNAQLAAEAAMAANEQGKFWPMHDKLFSNQQALDRASLERYAQELGLDMGKFNSALDTGKFKARVQQDASAAAAVGVSGTPTFFVNGKMLVGAQPTDAFGIPSELTRADHLLATGVAPENLYERILATNTPTAQ
jgi:protein-disulfide isomerase